MSPQMNASQRAMQLWSVLVFAAKNQQFLSYEMIFQMTGLPARGQALELGKIWTYCQRKGFPLITTIVLDKGTGRPGDPSLLAAAPDLEAEQRKVFIFDWFNIRGGCPKLSDFEK
jgi:hypothetical protein